MGTGRSDNRSYCRPFYYLLGAKIIQYIDISLEHQADWRPIPKLYKDI